MSMSDIREQVLAYLRTRPDLNIDHLTAHTGLALSTGRGFVSGSIPRCNSDRVQEEFARVLSLARRGEILVPGGGSNVVTITDAPAAEKVRRVAKRRQFYRINTVRRVAEVLDYCAEHAAIGVLTGDYGVGKTEAVKAWRKGSGRNVESTVVEFDGFMSSNRLCFLQELGEQIGVSADQNAGRLFQRICATLRESPCLLVFDQCETVHVRVFQIIRQIWDRTHEEGVGMVLLAAPVLLKTLLVSRSQDLGALTSRVGVWAPLAGVTKAEMAAILKQEGVTEVDELAFDLWWKAIGGSMRRLMRAVDLLQSKHAGKRVTVKTIAGVANHLWGMTVAGVDEVA